MSDARITVVGLRVVIIDLARLSVRHSSEILNISSIWRNLNRVYVDCSNFVHSNVYSECTNIFTE